MAIDIEWVAKYPTNSDEWVKTILIGGVLALLSILIVPVFLLYGYLLRVLRAGIAEADELPVFDDWGTLLRQGLVAFVVVILYQLIPLLVMAVTVGGSAAAVGTGSELGAGVGTVGLILGLLLSVLLALAFGYLMLIGLANYAHSGSFGDAFDVGVLRAVAVDRDYAIPWLYGVGIFIVASAVAGLLGVVPVLGAIVGVFVTFYGQVAASWVWGKGFGDAVGVDRESEPDPDPEPTL